MNRDNISAIVVAIAVLSMIVGFAVYFNTQGSAITSKSSEFLSLATEQIKNNGMIKVDKSQFKQANDFTGIAQYINTKPISLDKLKDKVVLVDFWTYSCINCIRTIPHLNEWYKKYSDKGLVIVGVHTPEFEFEKNTNNVKSAIEKFAIKYPVLQDNDKKTWNAYGNNYWPRKYLIDDEGYIRYDHIGEGAYQETEKVIQSLLAERAAHLGIKNINLLNGSQSVTNHSKYDYQDVNFSKIQSPELYFGYKFARTPLGNIEGFKPNQIVAYNLPDKNEIKTNVIYLEGKWKNNPDNMELQGNNGSIILKYNSKSVNIVAGGKGNLTVSQDGKLITNKLSQDTLKDGKFMIDGQRLYNLVTNKEYGEHIIEIDVRGNGFEIYTFTFG